ncbi:MAG: hypothetical protein IPH83_13765 [Gammaproteobacteria bacterium]|nr:hypothetical protein [Gammaproteobacteria bacterium]
MHRRSKARRTARGSCRLLRAALPTTILFNQTPTARLIAPRLAARLGVAGGDRNPFVEAQGSELEVRATAYGGDTHAVYRLPAPVNVVSIWAPRSAPKRHPRQRPRDAARSP